MPELPEVERAAAAITAVGAGKIIERVETNEDTIVYSECTHEEFAAAITGRTLKTAKRYGKVFYLHLEGEGKMPVLHFGMTGAIQINGGPAMYYRNKPSKPEAWPPRFTKFILHLRDPSAGPDAPVTQLAFVDARRLGRIRLCASPMTEPPISALGFDPILSMPSLVDFVTSMKKRTCPIKALLLDQSFSAGVGNYVADEILYHARVHPEQRCNTLTEAHLAALHLQTSEVCRIAVEANADDEKYPDNWLFKWRWGKGKKEKHGMLLRFDPYADQARKADSESEMTELESDSIEPPNPVKRKLSARGEEARVTRRKTSEPKPKAGGGGTRSSRAKKSTPD
ncbi:AtMMH-1 [Athelia psychrophila]|uniref:AtMMH-1 n=1 Tax=Athelia psychrophila TaxID=1759441 RepID=A0A166E049_9AGAM|nr:AtMMH-1 [Fibularhizoctonia sp. CBS 109695]